MMPLMVIRRRGKSVANEISFGATRLFGSTGFILHLELSRRYAAAAEHRNRGQGPVVEHRSNPAQRGLESYVIKHARKTAPPYSLFTAAIASFSDCRLSKKSLQGSARLSRMAKFPMLKSEGTSVGLTSDHFKGVEMGAFSRRRTE